MEFGKCSGYTFASVAHEHPCTHARKQMHDMDGSGWMNGMLQWMDMDGSGWMNGMQ